ncbi:hypothetical protein U2F10_02400 [Leptothoe sp. EHU-05/26/07-4]
MDPQIMVGTLTQTQTLIEKAKELGIKFFLVSYTDLLGGTRAKLVPATQIASVEKCDCR